MCPLTRPWPPALQQLETPGRPPETCCPNHSQAGRVRASAEDPGDSVNSQVEHPAFSSLFQGLARPSHRSDIPSARPTSSLAGGVNAASRGSQSRKQLPPQDRLCRDDVLGVGPRRNPTEPAQSTRYPKTRFLTHTDLGPKQKVPFLAHWKSPS